MQWFVQDRSGTAYLKSAYDSPVTAAAHSFCHIVTHLIALSSPASTYVTLAPAANI